MNVYQQIARNKINSIILMIIGLSPLVAVLVLVTWLEMMRWTGRSNLPLALGLSLAAAAIAVAAGALKLIGIRLDSELGWLVLGWVACVFSQATPLALGAVGLFVWLRQFVRERVALGTVLTIVFGGMPLPYSTMLFINCCESNCIV